MSFEKIFLTHIIKKKFSVAMTKHCNFLFDTIRAFFKAVFLVTKNSNEEKYTHVTKRDCMREMKKKEKNEKTSDYDFDIFALRVGEGLGNSCLRHG